MKKRMKKLLCLSMTIGCICASLVGCGSSDSKNVDSAKKSDDSSALKGAAISAFFDQNQYTPQLQKTLDTLQEDYDFTLDAQVTPADQSQNMLRMKAASGQLPDLVLYNSPHIFNLVDPVKDLYDLSDQEWAGKMLNPEKTQKDGKTYVFPLKAFSGYQSMIYNKDVFEENGIEIPTTPDEFYAVCDKLKVAGVTPILMASETWVPQIWMTSCFARAVGSDEKAQEIADKVFSGEADFSDYPEFAEVIDWVLDLNKKGYMNDDLATLGWDDLWGELADGKGAMVMGEGGMVGLQQGNYPDAHFGVFNVPAPFDEKDILSGALFTNGFVVSKKTQNIDAIEELFALLSSEKYGSMLFEETEAGFPAFDGIDGGNMQDDVRGLYEKHHDNHTMVSEMNYFWSSVEPVLGQQLWIDYCEALAKDNKDGVAIMEKFQQDARKYLEGQKK